MINFCSFQLERSGFQKTSPHELLPQLQLWLVSFRMPSASFVALAKSTKILQTLGFKRRLLQKFSPRVGVRVLATMSGHGKIDQFNLSPSSVLKLQMGDITAWSVDGSTDAIVSSLSLHSYAIVFFPLEIYVEERWVD